MLANDIDVDGRTLTAVLVAGPENGTVPLNEDGSFSYTPVEGFVGRDTFTYLAVANGSESNIATVTIDVGDLAPEHDCRLRVFRYGQRWTIGQCRTSLWRRSNHASWGATSSAATSRSKR